MYAQARVYSRKTTTSHPSESNSLDFKCPNTRPSALFELDNTRKRLDGTSRRHDAAIDVVNLPRPYLHLPRSMGQHRNVPGRSMAARRGALQRINPPTIELLALVPSTIDFSCPLSPPTNRTEIDCHPFSATRERNEIRSEKWRVAIEDAQRMDIVDLCPFCDPTAWIPTTCRYSNHAERKQQNVFLEFMVLVFCDNSPHSQHS